MILELNYKKRSWNYTPSDELHKKFFNLNTKEKNAENEIREDNFSKNSSKN